jgi:hypothetical protein
MCDALDALKSLYKNTSKPTNFAPSHLISVSINISLGILSRGIIWNLTFSSFFDARELTLGSSHRVVTIAWIIRLKWSTR